jgi:hypothetical protein
MHLLYNRTYKLINWNSDVLKMGHLSTGHWVQKSLSVGHFFVYRTPDQVFESSVSHTNFPLNI